MHYKKLHIPVMIEEILQFMEITPQGRYADLTFGEGGHSEAILDRGAQELWATDRDPEAVQAYREFGKYAQDPRLKLTHTLFSGFPSLVGDTKFDGILIDLGVSTKQILEEKRGFSFKNPGPLDMRMDPTTGPSLLELLETLREDELADILYKNADLHTSRSLSRRILKAFHAGQLKTTGDLANLFGKPRPGQSHPATPVLMALRMEVNQELQQIEETLPVLPKLLKPNGRLAVITFHSTEDRLVKNTFKTLAGKCICKTQPCFCSRTETVKILTNKPLTPSTKELRENPRSRSAKLRCVEKLPSET